MHARLGRGGQARVGVADDALTQGDGGRPVAASLAVPEGEPGQRAQGAGLVRAEQPLVVSGDLLHQRHLVVAPAEQAVAVRMALAGVNGVGVHGREAARPGVRQPCPCR